MLIFAGVVLVLCAVVLAFGIKIISQTDIAIVERLGRFHRVLDGGFHFIIPIIDRLSAVVSAREQMI
ncbi:SPFH domain-containing protein, partial [Helicobacter bilis]